MVKLDEITKIGFGCYRISDKIDDHFIALRNAIYNGCNLIDTASNYTNGDSEKLVGKVIKANPEKEIFVITKAGYISGNNLKRFEKQSRSGIIYPETVEITTKLKHSINPAYLDEQISISLKRLNRKYLDGFMLHSPELYFKDASTQPTQSEYYERIKKAFIFLEKKVDEGIIRYYGVSSNVLTMSSGLVNSTNLEHLVNIANQVRKVNHFKFIQFPFNIFEKSASANDKVNKISLIEFASKNGLKTIGNRPLNANTPDGVLKLVNHTLGSIDLRLDEGWEIFNKLMEFLKVSLFQKFGDDGIAEITFLQYLQENWMHIRKVEVFINVFDDLFLSFLNLLFDGKIPNHIAELFTSFKDISWQFHLKTSSTMVNHYLNQHNFGHLFSDNEPIQISLVKAYFKEGLDYILIGMNKPKYVEEMKALFTCN